MYQRVHSDEEEISFKRKTERNREGTEAYADVKTVIMALTYFLRLQLPESSTVVVMLFEVNLGGLTQKSIYFLQALLLHTLFLLHSMVLCSAHPAVPDGAKGLLVGKRTLVCLLALGQITALRAASTLMNY